MRGRRRVGRPPGLDDVTCFSVSNSREVAGSGLAGPERLSKTATLPERTAARSSCPEPDRLVGTLDDVDLLSMVLDGLHRLDSEGGAGDGC